MPDSRFADPGCILITGASGGLGSALALTYARPGRHLLLHGRDRSRLASLEQACRQAGATTFILECDLASAEVAVERLRELAAQHPPDLVVANAGITAMQGKAEDLAELAATQAILQVNLVGAAATVAGVLPVMLQRGRGQIALVSSLAGYHGLALTPAYSASKAGLLAYGEALRPALAARGIAVNVVLPGFIDTPMTRTHAARPASSLTAQQAARRIVLGLQRNQPCIAFPAHLALGLRLLRVLPPRLASYLLAQAGHGPRSASS